MSFAQKDRLDRIQHTLLSNTEKNFDRKRISGAPQMTKRNVAILIEQSNILRFPDNVKKS